MSESIKAPISAGQYTFIRVFMGCYLLVHFLHLLPYGKELFSNEGILPASLSPLLGIIPSPLTLYDSPILISIILSVGVICSVLIIIGSFDRIGSLVIVVLLGWLYARNPLIANPSLPVVGWMLVSHFFLPPDGYGKWSSRGMPHKWVKWHYPHQMWIAAWVLLAVAYSYSGYTKLLSPSWVDGSAIQLVLENPLARDHFIRELLLSLPPIVLQLLTWSVLVLELFFVLFVFSGLTRKWAWAAMFLIQFGFLTMLNFADLTFPMLLIHALTFDRNWLNKYSPNEKSIMFYDGNCGFCNGSVQFGLSEDINKRVKYSPLQGKTFLKKELTHSKDDSIILLRPTGETLYKSDAVIHVLISLGGIWHIVGHIIKIIPRTIRNSCYDFIGRVRYRLAGKIDIDSCQLLPSEYQSRMLP